MRPRPRDCIVEAVVRAASFAFFACAFVCGCAESRFMVDETALDGIPVSEQARQDPAPPVDTFWLQQALEESSRPPPRPVRSISLGYIGDAPLTGGMMRDTPMPAPRAAEAQLPPPEQE